MKTKKEAEVETNMQEDTDLEIQEVVTILDSNKAEDVVVLDLQEIHSYLSHFLIATALSKTHLRKLASDLITYFKNHNIFLSYPPHEKEFESGWIILDGGFFMVHIFLPEKREFYALEKLWQQARRIDLSREIQAR